MVKLPWYQRLTPPQWLAVYCLIIGIWSLIGATDFWVWVFEIYMGVIAVVVLLWTYRRFPFSNVLYIVVGVHFTVLAVGAHYTYAGMPLFNWLRDTFALSRNHYDRVGHFFQGFTPALVAREILLRKTTLKRGWMLSYIVVSICGAITAMWEILEAWIVQLFYTTSGPEWLGWQGDIWDAQNDMTMCFIGAILAVVLIGRLHDASIAKVQKKERAVF